MATRQDALVALVVPVVDAMGCRFWGLEYLSSGRSAMLRIYIENDPITWNYKAIFWGRRANKFRMPAERISEEKLLLANETSAIQSKPKHSSNWDL